MKKMVEKNENFLAFLDEWQALEDKAITSAEEVIKKTKNRLVKMTMELIKHDSEKHKIIQQMIRDTLTKETLHISPDELESLSDFLNRHIELESRSLSFADQAHKNSKLFATRYLLSIILADEAKHHAMLTQINELKRASIPSSTGTKSDGGY